MKLSFSLSAATGTQPSRIDVDIDNCIIAGWAGRDREAIEHHIDELADLGVARPSSVPLFYRVAANQLCQQDRVQVVGDASSGEAEAFLFAHQDRLFVSLASDHTDRKLEAHSVALSKQVCVKPVARDAWTYDSVADHWDALVLRAWIEENGNTVLYQEGDMAQLLAPLDLARSHFDREMLPDGYGMTCGTVAALGGIRAARGFIMELHDPVMDRRIRHRYTLDILPEVA
ncbi:DUF2848 domain-containing protein [Allopusillimonas soli]|uniref:DUF2848 domain-containing protein n=1 Tax=Allopusillimonas soli TaxID=659016 RepID=A0A853F9Y3_9BURK|nr:DUF2848 domain-containing protein [Allopusillimonas soli]NYT37505.1 DUF2848 domain-containing protein [Allopusillimonas soli]TEA74520.1 DUF2848 domain-containing protein [Allopusillimonas soli]